MSSMFKKKGGMAFKPKMPMARPRAPGAASSQPSRAPSSTATEPATQSENPTPAAGQSAQNAGDATGTKESGRVQVTDTPPLTNSDAIQTATPQTQKPTSEPTTASKPPGQSEPTTENATPSGETSTSETPSTETSTTPAANAPPPAAAQPTQTSTPAQLQTPPATLPSATDIVPSVETPAAPPASESSKAPAKRPRKRAPQADDDETAEASESAAASKPKRQRKKKDDATTADGSEAPKRPARPRKKKTAEDGAAAAAAVATTDGGEDSAGAEPKPKRPRRARSVTPEDAEDQEADLSVLTMGDLTRDLRIGKKFSRHDELLERHREKQAKARERLKSRRNGTEDPSESGTPAPRSANGTPAPAAAAPASSKPQPPAASASMGQTGPQFQIIDGQIVVDQNSLALDRHAIADANAEDMLEIEENDFTTLTTQNSYRTGSKLKGPNVWTEDETELFYRGLRMFGTDFQMISGMFPGKNRRHVKMKFNREERHAPARIDAILVGKKELQIDLEEYKTWTKAEYEPVEDIMAAHRLQQVEFDAEQAKAKAQKEADMARKKAALEDPGDRPGGAQSSSSGGKNKSRGQQSGGAASAGPQITVDADGMITIDETNMDPDAGARKKRGTGKAKKKAVEYNMRGEIIR
ncbi:myb-like DNA-binding domain-containing protein [Colletotrichum camelliae]|nr:myb-like DNA-binding domain-containing protein [Colletotrichum camelliae]